MPACPPRHPAATRLFACLVALLLAGCATFHQESPPPPSFAFAQPEQTSLGRAYQAQQAGHPGQSGFRFLNNGVSALLTRAAMIDSAERGIDLQYYIYDADETGRFLLDRLLAAAERGVRVRMLLDDHAKELDDELLARLSAHRNVDVRLFNPLGARVSWLRSLELVFQLDRAGRRMHNKVLAVDGQVAVLGGRNISNRYFEGTADANFRDIDLFVTGPLVRDVLHSFDEYWNSPVSVPIEAITVASPGSDNANTREPEAEVGPSAEYARRKEEFLRRVSGDGELIWAAGSALAEPPDRRSQVGRAESSIGQALKAIRQSVRQELLIQSAYFVPGEKGADMLAALASQGVRVRILTNSLAATDVVAVHAGYARYRERLLAGGVELHEYRPDSARPGPRAHRMRSGSSASALHAKIMVFDRHWVWVGSANFDPRSRRINTEAGLLIDSPALAARIYEGVERDFSPAQSWRLQLREEDGRHAIQWTGEREGSMVALDEEPDVGLGRSITHGLLSLIPGLEDLL